jgi:hypothetical protein
VSDHGHRNNPGHAGRAAQCRHAALVSGLCQLPPTADIPAHQVMLAKCTRISRRAAWPCGRRCATAHRAAASLRLCCIMLLYHGP